MIPISRRNVLFFLTFMSLVGIPVSVVDMLEPYREWEILIPLVVGIELVVYFMFAMFTNPRMTILTIGGISLLMALSRCFCSVCAAFVVYLTDGAGAAMVQANEVAEFWVGQPLSVAMQMIVLMLAAPHFLEASAPYLIGPEVRRKLGGKEPAAPQKSGVLQVTEDPETAPPVQVFSFEELDGFVTKTAGVDGFFVYNNEGLIVWRNLGMRLDADRLVARLVGVEDFVRRAIEDESLNQVHKVMIESREHLMCVMPLDRNFGMVAIFNGQLSPGLTHVRAGMLARAAREFLAWKYPGLPEETPRPAEVLV